MFQSSFFIHFSLFSQRKHYKHQKFHIHIGPIEGVPNALNVKYCETFLKDSKNFINYCNRTVIYSNK